MGAMSEVSKDLLPIATGPALDAVLKGHVAVGDSQSQRRRVRKHRVNEDCLRCGLDALNDLAGLSGKDASDKLSGLQKDVVGRLARDYHAVGLVDYDGTPLRAWQSLLGSRTGYASNDAVTGGFAFFMRGCVKLPDRGGVVELADCLPPSLARLLGDCSGPLRDEMSCQEKLAQLEGTAVLDPIVRIRGADYGELLLDMHTRGLIEPGTAGDIEMSLFFV